MNSNSADSRYPWIQNALLPMFNDNATKNFTIKSVHLSRSERNLRNRYIMYKRLHVNAQIPASVVTMKQSIDEFILTHRIVIFC